MAISYPLSFPTNVAIKNIKWTAMTRVAASESPFTGQEQVYEHQGQWFEAEITLPPMTRSQAEVWVGFFLALNGRAGTFTFGDPDNTSPQGVGTGTPLVNGGSQTGRTLVTDGWTAGQTGIMKAGDWIQLGDYAHKVTQDANSDGSGNATLEIWPNLRESPDNNDAITVNNTTSLWRLSSNKMMWSVDDLVHYGIRFTIREAL
jgi:hypothetical protein